MSIQKKSNNKRLLEALDYVDVKYVEELVDGLRLPKESAAAETGKRSFRTSVKYAALIAACALLLGAAIPVAGSLIRNITAGMAAAGSDSIESEPNYYIEEDLQVKEQTGDAFDGSPLFAVTNNENVCEIYTLDGKKLDFCICEETPCTCFSDKYFLTVCGNNIYYLRQLSSGIKVAACDASDPDNIRVEKRNLVGVIDRLNGGSFGTETHDIFSLSGTPYFYAYSKDGYTGEYVGLAIINISNLLDPEDEGVWIYSHTEQGNLRDVSTFLHINLGPSCYYIGVKDKESGDVSQISMLTTVKLEGTGIPGAEKRELVNKVLIDLGGIPAEHCREYLEVAEDGSVHYFRTEKDDKSENGYSLYQYIYRKGEAVSKVLRAKNVSDYILSDGYIYYTVNDSAENMIYRLPALELDYKPMLAAELGEEYEDVTFVQGADGGIAVSATKKSGDRFLAVTLLIGDGKNAITITELPDSYYPKH